MLSDVRLWNTRSACVSAKGAFSASLEVEHWQVIVKLFTRPCVCLLAGTLWGGLCSAQVPENARAAAPAVMNPTDSASVLRIATDGAWRRAIVSRETMVGRSRAEAERDAARRLWAVAPSLELQHRDDRLQGNAGRRESEIGVAWPLWLPRQRSANAAMAAAAVDRAGGNERAARLQVAGLVREAAWRLIADAGERDQLAAQAVVLRNLHDDVEKRVRAGDLAPADALLSQAEWLAARALLQEAEQRVDEGRIRWRDLTGLSIEPDRRSFAEAVEAAGVQGDHPELEAARRTAELARRRLDTVRVSTSASPELRLGVREATSGGPDGTQHSLTVGVRLPLATRDRNRPLEVAAQGDLDIALAAEQRLLERLVADAAAARSALASAERQLAVEQERSKLLQNRTHLIDRSFRMGQTSLPELLRAMGAAAQAHAAAVRQDANLGRARARLQQALGVEP